MSQGRKEGYKYAPYIPIKEFCYTIPDVEFVGYDKDGKAKFKKIKPKQTKDEKN